MVACINEGLRLVKPGSLQPGDKTSLSAKADEVRQDLDAEWASMNEFISKQQDEFIVWQFAC